MACYFDNLDGCNASRACRLGLQLCRCADHSWETRHSMQEYTYNYGEPISPNTNNMLTLTNNYNRHNLYIRPGMSTFPSQYNGPSLSKGPNMYDMPSLSTKWNRAQSARPATKTPSVTSRASSSRCKSALRPVIKDQHHQDSLFGNSFQSKSFFIVHPEWISETVDNTDPEPLSRPPWPWEQPRYRQNIQLPITYKVDETPAEQQPELEGDHEGEAYKDLTPPPLPYALPKGYAFTHPSIDECRPHEKNTQFGAPVVDTSSYKLSY